MDMFFSRRRLMHLLSASVLVTLATGCATGAGGTFDASSSKKDSGQAALLKRAQEYWAANQKNDSVEAWKYEELSKDPAWTLEAYLKRGGIVYDAVEVREVKEIEGDRAKVTVAMRYSVPMLRLKGQEAVAQDEWRLIDGIWFHARKAIPASPAS